MEILKIVIPKWNIAEITGYDPMTTLNRATNVLLLDEPTNHLDVDAKDELKRALQEYKGSILMVCHEPEFYDGLATQVWDLSRWTTKI